MRAAVIGTGRIARQHLNCLNTLPESEVVGVCDLSAVRAEAAAERYQVPRWFTDHRRLLEECAPEIVHVTTPVGSHFTLARDALEGGAHVLLEKPAVRSLDELRSLLELARERDRHLLEDHNYVFNQPVLQALAWARDGRLGSPIHVEVAISLDVAAPGSPFVDPNLPPPADLPGGAIADFVTHLASLPCAFLGAHSAAHPLWSKLGNSGLPADELRAVVEFDSGTAAISFSANNRPDQFLFAVEGAQMRMRANLFETGFTVQRTRRAPGPLQALLNGLDEGRRSAGAAVRGLWRKLEGGPGSYEGLWELVARTHRQLGRGEEPPVSMEDVERVNALAFALLEEAPDA
jgi:predicted dehydrogenase